MSKIDNLEIRSEEVQEVLGFIPRWIIRSGITVIFAILLILFIGSCFFKYPDIISSQISITTENPPASLIAKASGKFEIIFVKDKQQIDKGDILAIIENSANSEHISGLKKHLLQMQSFFIDISTDTVPEFNTKYRLGSLQSTYSSFLQNLRNYRTFKELNYHNKKEEGLQKQIELMKTQLKSLKRQSVLLDEAKTIGEKQYKRNETLFNKKVITPAEFENAEKDYIQKKLSHESSIVAVENIMIQINQIEQSVLELSVQQKQEENRLQNQLKSSYDILESEIKAWEMMYLFKSSIKGVVSFTKIWNKNQNITAGEVAFTVIPQNETAITGKLKLSTVGAGKVKIGQKVNIKFNGFPYMEYGTVSGKIKSVALVPEDEFYVVTVNIPQKLKTNYGKELPFSQKMTGTADIITENISVFARLFNPLRAVFEKYQ